MSESLKCPECDSICSMVVDSRPNTDNSAVRRRRECKCGHRYTTFETIHAGEPQPDLSIKRARLLIAEELLRLNDENGD